MYGKLFASMYDGSLRNHWQALVTLQQMVILCDQHGVVDMTVDALAARTNIPIDILRAGIEHLEAPDSASRSSEEGGRRIVRVAAHRSWGWRIVNHLYYRNLSSEEDRREKDRTRQARHRLSRKNVTCHAESRESRHTDADADADANAEAKAKSKAGAVAPRPTPTPRSYIVGEDVPGGALEMQAGAQPQDCPYLDSVAGVPLKGGLVAFLSVQQARLYAEAYPQVDVAREVWKMATWATSNPRKRKTLRGFRTFVNAWLAGAQRDSRISPTTAARATSEAAYLRRLEGRP